MPNEKMIYVYGSNLPGLSPKWRAWDCIGASEEELQRLCREKYGRVEDNWVLHQEPLSKVPPDFVKVHDKDIAMYGGVQLGRYHGT